MNSTYYLVLDIGTTGIKALVFDDNLTLLGKAYKRIQKEFPRSGFVEQNPNELVSVSIEVLKQVVEEQHISTSKIVSLGITNQRETTILWNASSSKPIYNAIVWEDNRTEEECKSLQKYEPEVREKTGLRINPYFSATKIAWILKNIPEASKLQDKGLLRFGTVDSWILWNLSEGKRHSTDYTNASRTLLYNINTLRWDKSLFDLFGVPKNILPQVHPSLSSFGLLKKDILGVYIPISAMCGDQQSSMSAAGYEKGTTKVTFGTGIFIMQSVGKEFMLNNSFFTTLVPSPNGTVYALEAKINESGKRADELLKNQLSLTPLLKELAQEVSDFIKKLPITPKELVIDGGIVRAEELPRLLEEISGIRVRTQDIYDGTALGVAKLLRSVLLKRAEKDLITI